MRYSQNQIVRFILGHPLAGMTDRIASYQLFRSIDRVIYRKKDELRS